MKSIESEGDSIEAAVESAVAQLGVGRDQVDVEILADASRGVLGFGARKAKVRVSARPPVAVVPPPPPPPLPARKEPPPAAAPASDEQVAARGSALLTEIVRHLGVEARVQVHHEEGQVVLDLTGDDSGILIGRRGQMLDALEYILNRIVLKDQVEAARLVIDSQGYRARRLAALEEMALRMADEAKSRNRPVTLDPMSPKDRRIVHLALQSDPDIETRSSGEGSYRQVVLIPKGARPPRRG